MARAEKRSNAKRANRPNPREDRNTQPQTRFNNNNVISIGSTEPRTKKKIELLPRNLRQEEYLDLIEDTTKDIVIGVGPAGSGKTYMATLYALREFLAGNIKKIIIARPIVGSGAGVGYLPGGIIEKLSPWCRPVLDILKEHLSVAEVEKMLLNEQIELLGLYAVRGMTLKNCIMILDESQNATTEEIKMVMTRLGDNARLLITGDVNQSDLRETQNGLRYVTNKISSKAFHSNRIAMSGFEVSDVVRHPVIEDVLRLFD